MPTSLTIFVPTYNSENTIYDTLISLVNQTLTPDKIIITDNNSTDNTVKIIKENFSNIEVIINPQSLYFNNKTNTEKATSNFNFINSICNTDFFTICHSDDIYDPNYARDLLTELKINSNSSAIFCRSTRLGSKNIFFNKITPRNILINFKLRKINILNSRNLLLHTILFGNIIESPSAMFRTNKIKNISYTSDYEQATDIDFYFKCSLNSEIIFYNKYLYKRRYHDQQDTFNGKKLYYTKILPFYDLMDFLLYTINHNFSKLILDIYQFNKIIDTIIISNGIFICDGKLIIRKIENISIFSILYVFIIYPKTFFIYIFHRLSKLLLSLHKDKLLVYLQKKFQHILLR